MIIICKMPQVKVKMGPEWLSNIVNVIVRIQSMCRSPPHFCVLSTQGAWCHPHKCDTFSQKGSYVDVITFQILVRQESTQNAA